MKSGRFKISWRDAINSLILMTIANLLMIIMSATQDKFPTLMEFKIGLINTIKFAVIPYLLKNFFTDDVKEAKKKLGKWEDIDTDDTPEGKP
jgi:anaerobic C4-dicarboxylate transporter